jgi:hypothetical protein
MSSYNNVITSAFSKQKLEVTMKRRIGDYRIEKQLEKSHLAK